MKKIRYLQGFYKPRNPEKYRGNVKNIVFRSSLEFKYFVYFDNNPSVLSWSSEEIVIKYVSPIDNRPRRYFIDAWARLKTKSGEEKEVIIEIKPFNQTIEPAFQSRATKQYQRRVLEYLINKAKWEAAHKYAKEKNMTFMILTERDI